MATCFVNSLYAVLKVIYRVFFSPLATLPGPRLAGVTYLYEFYYTAIRADLSSKLRSLHKTYGQSQLYQPRSISGLIEVLLQDPSYGSIQASCILSIMTSTCSTSTPRTWIQAGGTTSLHAAPSPVFTATTNTNNGALYSMRSLMEKC